MISKSYAQSAPPMDPSVPLAKSPQQSFDRSIPTRIQENPPLLKIVKRCLAPEPSKRPTASKLCSMLLRTCRRPLIAAFLKEIGASWVFFPTTVEVLNGWQVCPDAWQNHTLTSAGFGHVGRQALKLVFIALCTYTEFSNDSCLLLSALSLSTQRLPHPSQHIPMEHTRETLTLL